MLERWILLVDPDSNQFYTMNLSTFDVLIEKDVPLQLRKKAGQTILNINQLLRFDTGSWLFESESSKNYRFRKLPPYLLKKITCEYPTYICQSGLSLAFADTGTIDFQVNISFYHKEIVQLMKNKAVYNPNVSTAIPLPVNLLDSADEIIKKILRLIYKNYEVILKPKMPGKKFVLRIFGYREYLNGGLSMLSYDRIRLILRGVKRLHVILTEINKIDMASDLLLPIIERDSDDIKKGNIAAIDWVKMLNVPLFLWNPPFKLPTYSNGNVCDEEQFEKERKKFNFQHFEEISKPRVLNKVYMEEFNMMRKEQIKNGYIHTKNNVLYTGECDSVFRIKILGIENIFKLFELADEKGTEDEPHKCAIYNGEICPNFVTKVNIIRNKEEHITKSNKHKSKSKEDKNKRSLTPKLIKKKERESSYSPKIMGNSTEGLFSMHTQHGFSGASKFSLIAKKYGLSFPPYLIQVNSYLYFGSKLLSNNSYSQTIQIPFAYSPKWSQWVEFDGIKISQLPLESRVCIDILVYSPIGESQIIASTTFQIFDVNGKFNAGIRALNLWPFYRHESRLVCSGEFWGVKYGNLHSYDSTKDYISKEYGRLFIETQKFENIMMWSIRDNEVMSLLGFPNLKEIKIEKDEEGFNLLENMKKVAKNMKKVADKIGLRKLKQVLTNRENDVKQEQEEEKKKVEPILDWHEKPTNEDLPKLQALLSTNPLARNKFTEEDKYILLKCRNHYKTLPKALAIFISAINWADPDQVGEVHRILKTWAPLSPQEALPLLDAHIADEAVRLYAVERISTLSDDELSLYMLELIQALMFESHHCSPLSEFLLERALANPFMVGTALFWHLRSQLHMKPSYERFSLILETLMFLCGQFREELLSDVKVNDGLMKIAEDIKKMDKVMLTLRANELRTQLKIFKKKFPESFCLAIDSRWEVEDFILEKCQVMNSKKLPLWLVCSNSQKGAPPLKMLFKCGDDLRQDQVAMQLINIMDRIWLDNGYDFRMKPYRVLATYDQVGMLEVVLDAETTSSIHVKYGGTLGALKEDTIMKYLREHNTTPETEKYALDNFIRSCAGYCVATYILGIGDRHSGNIMITTSGHLFHIDFGHFLGNFKTKFGFKRERSPFVLTEEMAYVMGGPKGDAFKTFEEFCVRGYNLVRKNGHFIISIFMLMLSAGMPELSSLTDIEYLSNQLSLNLSEQEANNKFRKEIQDCLKSSWRKIDNLLHSMKRN